MATIAPDRRTLHRLLLALAGGAALIVTLVYVGARTELLHIRIGKALYAHTATLLPDGTVLVIGEDDDRTIERYDPARDRWQQLGQVPQKLWQHSATLLPDGRVLVAGTAITTAPYYETYSSFAQVYTPATRDWSPTYAPPDRMATHTATLLRDGTVLFASEDKRTSAIRYDPSSDRWLSVAPLPPDGVPFAATLLADGRVLVIGGTAKSGNTTAAIYDPAADRWLPASNLRAKGSYFTATLLGDGRVLVTGGDDARTAELYDPATDRWALSFAPRVLGRNATATLLRDGTVLVVGGEPDTGPSEAFDTAVRYDPRTGGWSQAGRLAHARNLHTATLLPDGSVLVADGLIASAKSAERYDPRDGRWRMAGGIGIKSETLFFAIPTIVAVAFASLSIGATVFSETRFGGWWFTEIDGVRHPQPRDRRAKARVSVANAIFVWLAGFLVQMTFFETSLWSPRTDSSFMTALLCFILAYAVLQRYSLTVPRAEVTQQATPS